MEKKHYFFFAIVVVICATVYLVIREVIPREKDPFEKVKCGNRVVYRYKDPERMFPVLTRDYAASFELTGALLKSMTADSTTGGSGVSLDVENSARELRDKLDQDNIFFQNQMKAAFEQANRDPCNEILQQWYRDLITEMTERVIQLKQFVADATIQAGAQPKDSIRGTVIVVDTAGKTTFPSTDTIPDEQLVVVKNTARLSAVLKTLERDYKIRRTTLRGGTERLREN